MFRNTMELDQSLFGKSPKAFQGIDVYFSFNESLLMINLKVSISTEHKAIIALKFVCIDNTSSSYSLDCGTKKLSSRDILNHLYLYLITPLDYSKDRNFICCSSSSFASFPTAKVGLICLNLSFKQAPVLIITQDGFPYDVVAIEYRWIAQLDFPRCPTGRYLQFKELDQVKPVPFRDPESPDPSTSKVRKGISTPFTSIPFILKMIESIPSTPYAETMVVFPTQFLEVFTCN